MSVVTLGRSQAGTEQSHSCFGHGAQSLENFFRCRILLKNFTWHRKARSLLVSHPHYQRRIHFRTGAFVREFHLLRKSSSMDPMAPSFLCHKLKNILGENLFAEILMEISKTCISFASMLPWDELERLCFDKIAFENIQFSAKRKSQAGAGS